MFVCSFGTLRETFFSYIGSLVIKTYSSSSLLKENSPKATFNGRLLCVHVTEGATSTSQGKGYETGAIWHMETIPPLSQKGSSKTRFILFLFCAHSLGGTTKFSAF